MVLEVATSKKVGGFLRMIATLYEGKIYFGPDFVRMRFKYEVTSGSKDVN